MSSPRTSVVHTAQNQHLSRARRVLAACALLRRAGCRIVSASANGRPRIRVDRRPRLDWIAPARKVIRPAQTTLAARIGDIQIEWEQEWGMPA